MAERRMFAKTIIDSDAFLDMPLSTQALYFHLSMRADDEGFINNPKRIQRTVGASEDDLKLLIAKRFIIVFESGVIVIKHWRIHNYIQKDRKKSTLYQEERKLVSVKPNGAYTMTGYSLDTECVQDGYSLDTQSSIGKVRLGKDRLGKCSSTDETTTTTTPIAKLGNEFITQEDIDKLKEEGFSHELIKSIIEKIVENNYYGKLNFDTIKEWCIEHKDDVKKKTKSNKFGNFHQRDNKAITEEILKKQISKVNQA